MAKKSRTRRYLQRKALERLPAPALDLIGRAVVEAVDRAAEHRWDAAVRRAAAAEGDTVDERVRNVNRRFRRELTTMGAASGAVAATPGLGTGAAASAIMADLGWLALRTADLVMTIGAVNGYTEATVDERRAWVLSVLAFGEQAADEFAALLGTVGVAGPADGAVVVAEGGVGAVGAAVTEHVGGWLAGVAGGDAATIDALRRVNASLAGRVVARYGSRRGVIAFGKLLPFGVGAAVGAGTTWALIRGIGGHAERFFTEHRSLASIPPPRVEDVIPTTGRPVVGDRRDR